MQQAIVTEHLSKRYGDRLVVDDLCLEVARGEVFGFLGPNGAGKTTVIAMLLGLVRPSAGRAWLLGHEIGVATAAALQRVGAMIEAPAFYPYLSGRDNLRVLTLASGLDATQVETALVEAGLHEHGRRRFGVYSQGMKQRLAIAAALLHNPELVMLDEPTNGLDPAGTVETRALIRSLATAGRTVFLCSHVLHEVEQLCTRVAILKQGRLVAEGVVSELLRHGRGLQLRVDDASGQVAEEVIALLERVEWVAATERQGDVLLVDAPSSRAAELNRLLAQQGIAVAEIRTGETSLEAFFLEAVKEP